MDEVRSGSVMSLFEDRSFLDLVPVIYIETTMTDTDVHHKFDLIGLQKLCTHLTVNCKRKEKNHLVVQILIDAIFVHYW